MKSLTKNVIITGIFTINAAIISGLFNMQNNKTDVDNTSTTNTEIKNDSKIDIKI